MIAEGVLENPKPSTILGQHVFPELAAGKVGMKSGKYMASTDEIFITVKGKGGHGAIPHKNIDPVLIASHLVVALQQVVSRNSDPAMPTVLSFGKFTKLRASQGLNRKTVGSYLEARIIFLSSNILKSI